jgi:hypothetical protein
MKYFGLFFFAIFFLVSCGENSHPKEVYKSYISEVQKVESLSEFPFSSYLSKRAQRYTAAKMDRVGIKITDISINGVPAKIKKNESGSASMKSKNMEGMFLEVWKSEAFLPSKYSEEWVMGEKEAEWTFIGEGVFEPGAQGNNGKLKTIVHFVDEDGWKIDKIVRIRKSKDGSSIKSITY